MSTIKTSKTPGVKPNVSQIQFDQLSWNINDGLLYGKGLDENGKEIICTIGDKTITQKGDKHYAYIVTHQQNVVIQHNLNKNPSVCILDQQHMTCIADIEHLDLNQTKITFEEPFTGTITFN